MGLCLAVLAGASAVTALCGAVMVRWRRNGHDVDAVLSALIETPFETAVCIFVSIFAFNFAFVEGSALVPPPWVVASVIGIVLCAGLARLFTKKTP